MSPDLKVCKKGSLTTTNRKSRFFTSGRSNKQGEKGQDCVIHGGFGSENAPDESGFISDEEANGDCRPRIVNESSLRNAEDEEYSGDEIL